MNRQVIHFTKLLILVFALLASSVHGQSHDDPDHHEHEFKRFRVAVNLAHAYMPAAEDLENNFVIIPVWGLDFQYWFNEHWAVGSKNDIEIAKYVLPESDDSGEVQLRENPLILSVPVYYSPWKGGLTFFAGPGIEIEEHHNFWIARFGLGYEFHLSNNWDFAPEFVYDLKNGSINSFTIAIGVGKKF